MSNFATEYCAIVSEGVTFDDPRLDALREGVKRWSDVERAIVRLEEDDDDVAARALRAWLESKMD